MSKCEEEFNPWPSFVDIFSSVILVLLLFLLVVLVNLGYYAQFKYKVSYTGSISSDSIILNNNKSADASEIMTTKAFDPSAGSSSNSDLNIKIIEEQKQMILALQNQIKTEDAPKSSKGTDEAISAGIDVADKAANEGENQKIIENNEYMIVTYKENEIFVDDAIGKKIKQFLSIAKDKYKNDKVHIYSYDIQEQISATISKQISLGRTMSARNLIRKFGYEKKDIVIDLSGDFEIKEKIDNKNGYLIIKTVK